MRIYDPRIGRFLSVDPLSNSYPFYTPYQFASNSPISSIDIDGMEGASIVNHQFQTTTIVIELVYYTEKGLEGRFTHKQADQVRKSILKEFDAGNKSSGRFVDKRYKAKYGNPYSVKLIINIVEFPIKEEAEIMFKEKINHQTLSAFCLSGCRPKSN